jgi:hypothetical protein
MATAPAFLLCVLLCVAIIAKCDAGAPALPICSQITGSTCTTWCRQLAATFPVYIQRPTGWVQTSRLSGSGEGLKGCRCRFSPVRPLTEAEITTAFNGMWLGFQSWPSILTGDAPILYPELLRVGCGSAGGRGGKVRARAEVDGGKSSSLSGMPN